MRRLEKEIAEKAQFTSDLMHSTIRIASSSVTAAESESDIVDFPQSYETGNSTSGLREKLKGKYAEKVGIEL